MTGKVTDVVLALGVEEADGPVPGVVRGHHHFLTLSREAYQVAPILLRGDRVCPSVRERGRRGDKSQERREGSTRGEAWWWRENRAEEERKKMRRRVKDGVGWDSAMWTLMIRMTSSSPEVAKSEPSLLKSIAFTGRD